MDAVDDEVTHDPT